MEKVFESILKTSNEYSLRKMIGLLFPGEVGVYTVEDACVVVRRQANRYGVPADAVTLVIEIQEPEAGWSFLARAVWRCGKLLAPSATHTRILRYDSLNAPLVDEATLVAAVNDWMMGLPL